MPLTPDVADVFNMQLADDPYWSESSWFSWAIPERRINGFFYYHFRPNMRCLLGGPAMWDGSGGHAWDCLYYDWQLMRPLPAGTYGVDYNKYAFETPWGMSVTTLEPMRRYRLGYARNGFRLDLEFEGVAPPNVIGDTSRGDMKDAYRLHFEQPGRIRGTVELDGEVYAVDCYGIRDGSHGRRNLDLHPPGGYTWSTADAGHGWHILAPDKAWSWERELPAVGGYILRDGTIAPLASGLRRVVERSGARPEVVEVELVDTLGRRLEARGRAVTAAEWILFPDHAQWWTLFEWEYDGFRGAVGEDQEYYALDDFRRWHRDGPVRWSTR